MELLRRNPGAACLLLALLLCLTPVRASQVSEADVKAAYLFNFTRFVEWPAGTPADAEPFRLCVIADRTMTAVIQKTMHGESVQGRPAVTTEPGSVQEARRCQLLFVGRGAMDRAAPLLAGVRDQPVLTVSDAPRFAARGGMIEFVREGEHVRFAVNVDAAKRAGLTISSRLLRVARGIEGTR
jgi:hypothetical protein